MHFKTAVILAFTVSATSQVGAVPVSENNGDFHNTVSPGFRCSMSVQMLTRVVQLPGVNELQPRVIGNVCRATHPGDCSAGESCHLKPPNYIAGYCVSEDEGYSSAHHT